MKKPPKNIITRLLAVAYGAVTDFRNMLYDKGMIKSTTFSIPIIAVGNLAVGGTGKTPHTELLLELLADKYQTAVLSRGYLRQTKGFYLANSGVTAIEIGDEPFQMYSKYPNIKVAVAENRTHGIQKLMALFPDLELVLLDDAFQHRAVAPGHAILLTDMANLYADDAMLPYGFLREKPKNSKRADMVIVTKCPINLEVADKEKWRKKLHLEAHQRLFFSAFEYGTIYSVFGNNNTLPMIETNSNVLILTAIERPEPLIEHVKSKTTHIVIRNFPDHHTFSKQETEEVEDTFFYMSGKKIIITTEKDAARLKSKNYFSDRVKKCIFALPIKVRILNDEQPIFNQQIIDYVKQNKRNS